MRIRTTRAVLCTVALALATSLVPSGAPATPRLANDDQTIGHVLNRLGFGARPGDVERVRAMGVDRYIDEQLHPERIADPDVERRLAGLTTLKMSSRQIAEEFEIPQLQARRAARQSAAKNGDKDGEKREENPRPDPEMQRRANSPLIELSEQKILRAVYSDATAPGSADRLLVQPLQRRRAQGRRPVHADRVRARRDSSARARQVPRPARGDGEEPGDALLPRQLDERRSERSARRAGAAARRARSASGGRCSSSPSRRPRQNPNAPKGLNENYGRELMELHTLGVDGGYTQKDVTEVARAFTGWTIQNPRHGRRLPVRAAPSRRRGRRSCSATSSRPAAARATARQVLDILARHPSTARFIATKLVRRFVERHAAAGARRSRGGAVPRDRRRPARSDAHDPDVARVSVGRRLSRQGQDAVRIRRQRRARRPARTSQDARPLVRQVQQLGMPLYQCQPPTGYKDTADAWVNTGALVGRMNFALSLASNKLRGIVVVAGAAIGLGSRQRRAVGIDARHDREGDQRAADRRADARLAGIPAEMRSMQIPTESFSRTARSRWSAWASRRRSSRARRTRRAADRARSSSSRSFSAAPSTA